MKNIRIERYKIKKDDLLKDMPNLLYKLKVDYNFWWGQTLVRAKKDIEEITNKTRNRHRITVYFYEDKRLYFVVLANKKTTIYLCEDYMKDPNENRVHYFIRKLRKYYSKASKEYEVQQFSQTWNQYQRG